MGALTVLAGYLDASKVGVDAALAYVAPDAVFDVGRGRYAGADVRAFLDRLQRVHSVTTIADVVHDDDARVVAVLDNRDDDLTPLGIEAVQLDVEVDVAGGRITRFTARPTAASLAELARARDAGRTSEGLTLAERAGTLPAGGEG